MTSNTAVSCWKLNISVKKEPIFPAPSINILISIVYLLIISICWRTDSSWIASKIFFMNSASIPHCSPCEPVSYTHLDEGIRSEFIAIVNYGIVGLIQLELGYAESADISNEEAMTLYDKYAQAALELMLAKNHDYDEAWRSMRVSSYTDLILMKIYRTKQIESLSGNTLVSEGIDANYMDMINYSAVSYTHLSLFT